jgi:hypothetical protein
LWGDINGDGSIDPLDVQFMVAYVFTGRDARVQPPNCYAEVGDVNCDGGVDPLDVSFMANKVFLGRDALCPNPCTIHGF